MRIEFDEEELRRAALEAVKQWVRERQPELEEFGRRNNGRPVAEIKRDLALLIRSWDGNIADDDPDLMKMATAISKGERVVFNPKVA